MVESNMVLHGRPHFVFLDQPFYRFHIRRHKSILVQRSENICFAKVSDINSHGNKNTSPDDFPHNVIDLFERSSSLQRSQELYGLTSSQQLYSNDILYIFNHLKCLPCCVTPHGHVVLLTCACTQTVHRWGVAHYFIFWYWGSRKQNKIVNRQRKKYRVLIGYIYII